MSWMPGFGKPSSYKSLENEANMIQKDPGQPRDVKMTEYHEHDKPSRPSIRDDVPDAPQPPARAVRQPAEAVQAPPAQQPPSKSVSQAQHQAKEVQDRDRDKRSQPHEEDKRYPPTSKPEERSHKADQDRLIGKPPIPEEAHHPSTHQSRKSAEQPRPGYTSSSASSYAQTVAQHASAVSGSTRNSGRDEELPQASKKYAEPSFFSSRTSASSQTELLRRYEARLGDYKAELHTRMVELRDRDEYILSLQAKVADVQRNFDEQAKTLTSVRQDLKSSQSQLDNVQRFISTADAHADQDIISKLQELNEEVYQTSMTMADRVAELFMRQVAAERQTKAPTSVGFVGQVMLNYLADMKEDEDIALFLQIAFQAHLVDLLHYIVSSWTEKPEVNEVLEATYQRLRKAETQAISGRWRALTRAHIQPTPIGNTTFLIQRAIVEISNLARVAGFVVSDSDIQEKLFVEFGEKISTIVLHAGKFGHMIAGMVSGDFEVFVVQPGDPFKTERMIDINAEEAGAGAPRGTVVAQTVLCITGVGLKKNTGDKVIPLTKAKVVLESFLNGSSEPRGEK